MPIETEEKTIVVKQVRNSEAAETVSNAYLVYCYALVHRFNFIVHTSALV